MTAPKHIREKLEELRKFASLETASFGMTHDKVQVVSGPRASTNPQSVDAFVKEETRIHRQSYILPLIDELIQWAEPNSNIT